MSLGEAAVAAIAAGCDAVLFCNSTIHEQVDALEALIRAVERGAQPVVAILADLQLRVEWPEPDGERGGHGAGRARHHYVVHPHAALWRGGEPVAGALNLLETDVLSYEVTKGGSGKIVPVGVLTVIGKVI